MRNISKWLIVFTVFVMCAVMMQATRAEALLGLLTCPQKLNACKEDLQECSADSAACDSDLSTCESDLTQAQDELESCNTDLSTCNSELDTCSADLAACEAESQSFPGDGYPNPDAFGVSGHGPALDYTDNGDGTFTDNNTKFMWEIKDDAGGVHDVDNNYTWTDTTDGEFTDPDGTLFTDFLEKLNNRCDGDETTACTSNADCVNIGNGLCGHAGYRDWCIPNIKQLQSIVNYSKFIPASSFPGLTAAPFYWSATTIVFSTDEAWGVSFDSGNVSLGNKFGTARARGVRPCL